MVDLYGGAGETFRKSDGLSRTELQNLSLLCTLASTELLSWAGPQSLDSQEKKNSNQMSSAWRVSQDSHSHPTHPTCHSSTHFSVFRNSDRQEIFGLFSEVFSAVHLKQSCQETLVASDRFSIIYSGSKFIFQSSISPLLIETYRSLSLTPTQ